MILDESQFQNNLFRINLSDSSFLLFAWITARSENWLTKGTIISKQKK